MNILPVFQQRKEKVKTEYFDIYAQIEMVRSALQKNKLGKTLLVIMENRLQKSLENPIGIYSLPIPSEELPQLYVPMQA